MKKIVLCAVCAGWLFFPVTVNSKIAAYPDSKEVFETEPIDLKGELDPGHTHATAELGRVLIE